MTKNRILVRGMVLLFSLVVALVLCAGAFFVVNDNGEFSGRAASMLLRPPSPTSA